MIYTCIINFAKNNTSETFKYTQYDLKYNTQTSKILNKSDIDYNIGLITIQTTSVNQQTIEDIATIFGGLATLKDKVFIHTNKLFDEPGNFYLRSRPTQNFT